MNRAHRGRRLVDQGAPTGGTAESGPLRKAAQPPGRWSIWLLALVAVVANAAPAAAIDGLSEVLAGEHRSPANRARDAWRHPAETLAFFGLRPSMTVVEVYPGAGWYTEILAPLLRDKGKLIAAHYGESTESQYRARSYRRYLEKLAERPDIYDRVEVIVYDPPAKRSLGPAGSADMVVTFRSLHNMVGSGTAKTFFASAFAVLRHGGILGVVQHRAPEGASAKESARQGYVPQRTVVELARSAGFVLAGETEVNANPDDTKDYPNGVWALPPTYGGPRQHRAKYAAIGESDRMTLRFVKAGRE